MHPKYKLKYQPEYQTDNKDHNFIPYARQSIDETDIHAVTQILRSDWLTTGPMIEKFEHAVAGFVGAKYAVAVSSGTAALHSALHAAGIGSGDEVILPPITYAATANAVVFVGGTPVFADVDYDTLLIDPQHVEKKITSKTKAIVAVDYAGHPCDYDTLRSLADAYDLILISDACHALGAKYKKKILGTSADLTVFSFHPVKHITTGEGGMVVTDNSEFADKMQKFRNHGINTDHRQRALKGTWFYEMTDLGFNYRISDIQCALGINQLKRLQDFLSARQKIAAQYNELLEDLSYVYPLSVHDHVSHGYHLYVVKIDFTYLGINRPDLFLTMQKRGIGINVHYVPVHLHPYYRNNYGTKKGLCPKAEAAYEEILSLPIYPLMKKNDVTYIIHVLSEITADNTAKKQPLSFNRLIGDNHV